MAKNQKDENGQSMTNFNDIESVRMVMYEISKLREYRLTKRGLEVYIVKGIVPPFHKPNYLKYDDKLGTFRHLKPEEEIKKEVNK